MKNGKRYRHDEPIGSGWLPARALSVSLLMILLLLPMVAAGRAQSGEGNSLAMWLGTWKIVDEGAIGKTVEAGAVVEIRLTADGRGLEISRQTPEKTAVQETIIPDGVARPMEAAACTGTQTARWLPEAGAIAGSSETSCKDSGAFATSSLRILLPEGKMADILAVKSSGQTRVAVRRFAYVGDLPSSVNAERPPEAAAANPRSMNGVERFGSLSRFQTAPYPWTLDRIIHLGSLVDSAVLEAALLEKNVRLNLTAESLKRLAAAGVSDGVIDLMVALAYPEKFDIQRNGQVEFRPPSPSLGYGFASARVDLTPRGLSLVGHQYDPGAFYGCPLYDPSSYGPYYLSSPYADYYSRYNCWTYYSPGWWDRPIYFDSHGAVAPAPGGRLNANTGYTQVEIIDTGRRAVAREDYNSRTGSAGGRAASGESSSSSGSASSGGSSGSSSSGSGSSGSSSPGASPGGYSSGRDDGGGGSARPR